jgi:hypothetical protein
VAHTERLGERVNELAARFDQHQMAPHACTERRLEVLEERSEQMAEQLAQVARDVSYLRGRAEGKEQR